MGKNGKETDAREFSRVYTKPSAMLSLDGGDDAKLGQVVDISLGGALIEGDFGYEDGTEVTVSILLGGDKDGETIEAGATVVRTDSGCVAVVFRELRGPESYGHLRNLVLYNAETTASIVEEFQQHTGITRGVNAE